MKEQELKKEIEKVRKVMEILHRQPRVRGELTDNPNIEDVRKWKRWYKEYHNYRKQGLNLEELEAELKGYQQAKSEAIKDEIKFLQILCMSGGINKVAMKIVFDKIEELKLSLNGGKK